jgi:ABC-type multidrug transport system fused ATPase/permease subunit
MNPFMGNMLLVWILYATAPYLEQGVISPGDVTALLLYATFTGAALAGFGNFYTNMNKGILLICI